VSYDIVIRLTVPDGTTVRFDDDTSPIVGGFVPPYADELIPLPDAAIPLPGDPVAFRAPQARSVEVRPALCPIHHEPWKVVPAGVSKKTGRPYDAFQACPVRGCDQRPAA